LELWSRLNTKQEPEPLHQKTQEPEPQKLCGSCTSSWKIKSIRKLVNLLLSLGKIGKRMYVPCTLDNYTIISVQFKNFPVIHMVCE